MLQLLCTLADWITVISSLHFNASYFSAQGFAIVAKSTTMNAAAPATNATDKFESNSQELAPINVTEACIHNFSNQGKNYHKTDFVMHSRVADVAADYIGGVFYDGDSDKYNMDEIVESDGPVSPWDISPENLMDIVIANIVQEGTVQSSTSLSDYPIYGSAIAFEPGVWNMTDGLVEGVTYPASSKACWVNETYCSAEVRNADGFHVTTLNTNSDGLTIYSPYAYRGPDDETIYANCSREQPMYCPSMDLSFAYDYSNASDTQAEWFSGPRCLYLRDGITAGYWTSPYFDVGGGGINMVTYSQPIISRGKKFLGVVTIDVQVEALCYGEQCNEPIEYNYLSKIRPVGLAAAAVAMAAAVGCGVWTYCNRQNAVVKASQPFFLVIICVGCFVMTSSIIPLSVDDSIASQEGASMVSCWILCIWVALFINILHSYIIIFYLHLYQACMAFPWLLVSLLKR